MQLWICKDFLILIWGRDKEYRAQRNCLRNERYSAPDDGNWQGHWLGLTDRFKKAERFRKEKIPTEAK